ncbi:hypothetical protein [Histidinibacterium aquaticum]|uniref:hypothetical protein n=1 Tax=Histidinibacterium aquaticum TaxID=2613962 RepID=UPI00168AF306|nr:hypothetical protein [Histidinibacterium aquaticum]
MNRDIGLTPDNLAYNKTARTNVRGSVKLLEPDPSRSFVQLSLFADGFLGSRNAT